MKETLIKTFTEAQTLTFDKRDWENEETFDELHVTSFSNKFYKQYINFENLLQNIQLLIENKMNYQNDKKEQLEDLANDILEQIPYDESDYNSYNINNNNDFVDAVEQLKIILITYGYEEIDLITYENIIKIVKNYFYVKQNKKSYSDYLNSNIENVALNLKQTINNAVKYFQNDRKIMIIQFVQKVFKSIFKIKLKAIDNLVKVNPNVFSKENYNNIKQKLINYKNSAIRDKNLQLERFEGNVNSEINYLRRYIGDPDNFSKELNYTSSRISIYFSTYCNNINYDLERYFDYSKQEIDKLDYDANIEGGKPLEAFKEAENRSYSRRTYFSGTDSHINSVGKVKDYFLIGGVVRLFSWVKDKFTDFESIHRNAVDSFLSDLQDNKNSFKEYINNVINNNFDNLFSNLELNYK